MTSQERVRVEPAWYVEDEEVMATFRSPTEEGEDVKTHTVFAFSEANREQEND